MTFLEDSFFVPALTIALLGWLVPKLLSMILPEGIPALLLNALISTLVMFAISTVCFVLLYVGQGVSLSAISGLGLAENIVFFGKLGLIAGLIWAPFVLLSVAYLPRSWVRATW